VHACGRREARGPPARSIRSSAQAGEPHHHPGPATETTISVDAVHPTGTRATWAAAMSPAAFTTACPTLPPAGYRRAVAGDRDMRGLE
jgi:hypothetical protein